MAINCQDVQNSAVNIYLNKISFRKIEKDFADIL